MKWNCLVAALVGAMLASCAALQKPSNSPVVSEKCSRIRAAFDVGSGSTKMKVAQIDICSQRIVKVLEDRSVPIAFEESRRASKNNEIAADTKTEAIEKLRVLKGRAEELGARAFIGVATSAFRKARNGSKVLTEISTQTKITLKAVSEEEEGRLGFWGAVAHETGNSEQVVVWDVGGGSQQWATLERTKRIKIHSSDFASIGFKEAVIRKIQRADPKKKLTPNPLEANQVTAALEIAKEEAKKLPNRIHLKAMHPDARVLGIGGVHYYSVKGRLGVRDSGSYTANDIRELLPSVVGKTDEELKSDYAATEVTNLLLILGMMEGLDIGQVFPLKANLADGVLVQNSYWPR